MESNTASYETLTTVFIYTATMACALCFSMLSMLREFNTLQYHVQYNVIPSEQTAYVWTLH